MIVYNLWSRCSQITAGSTYSGEEGSAQASAESRLFRYSTLCFSELIFRKGCSVSAQLAVFISGRASSTVESQARGTGQSKN